MRFLVPRESQWEPGYAAETTLNSKLKTMKAYFLPSLAHSQSVKDPGWQTHADVHARKERKMLSGKVTHHFYLQLTNQMTVGWHHWLNGHEFDQAPGDCEGQGNLTCCSPWGRRVGHDRATEQQQQLHHSQLWCLVLPSYHFVVKPIFCVGLFPVLVSSMPLHMPLLPRMWSAFFFIALILNRLSNLI